MEVNKKETPKGWYSRGKLPHYDGGTICQFITFRLFDSLPVSVLKECEDELALRNVENIPRERLVLIDKYLDKGVGACFLRDQTVARILEDTLLHHNGTKYDLYSWVIMPNHAHLLLRPFWGLQWPRSCTQSSRTRHTRRTRP